MHATLPLMLASAEAEVPLIDIDHTLWIQLGLFLVLLAFLTRFVFRPYLKLRDAREASMAGARREAGQLDETAAARLRDYEARLEQARARGAEEGARLHAEGAAREAQVVAAARTETAAALETARASLGAQAVTLRAAMKPRAAELAGAIVTKLVGRPL